MELSLGVTLAVLGAGFLHASWNALLKSSAGGDALLDTAAVVTGSSLWGLVFVGLVPFPAPEAWRYIAASSVIHFGYYVTLSQAYRTGDLSFAYPLMRGTAPLLVTILGAIVLRELPSAQMAVGIALISLGIVSIAFVQRRDHPRAAAYWAFANACIIAMYTLVDGAGARASGNAISYVTWLIFLEGIPFIVWVIVRRGRPALSYLRGSVRIGLVGGGCSLAAYAIVLWAMTRAPIAAVAALRETSVLFAALMGSIWLKEGFGWRRLAGAASVVAGIAALKLG
ncbi:MAG: EamA family transporter [Pseudomonadota bacterium]|nr:EamA family transporter [Pseudomonadota bacterium]